MEIAEICLHRIQQQNLPSAPFKEPLLMSPFLYSTINDLTQEHRHRILIKIVPYTQQRMTRSEISCGIESRLRRFCNICLKDIQRQKKGHQIFSSTAHKKTTPSIVSAKSVDDDRIFSEFGSVENYQFRAGCHLFLESHSAIARSALPLCEISFFCSSEISARVIPGNSSAIKIGSYPKPPLPDFS